MFVKLINKRKIKCTELCDGSLMPGDEKKSSFEVKWLGLSNLVEL